VTPDSTSEESHKPKDAHKLPVVTLNTSISKYPLQFLLDTGSSVNMMHEDHVSPGVRLQVPKIVVSTLGGNRVSLKGIARKVHVRNGPATLGQANFLITNERMKGFDGILGAPFLNQAKVAIDFQANSMHVSNHLVKFAKTIETNLCNVSSVEMGEDEENVLECYHNWIQEANKDNVILRVSERTDFPAWHTGVVKVHCPKNYENELFVVEPQILPNSLVIGGAVIQPEKYAYLPVMNLSFEPLVLKRGTFVAHAQHITDPRMIIGAEEEFTEEEYVNFVRKEPLPRNDHEKKKEKVNSKKEKIEKKETQESVVQEKEVQKGTVHERSASKGAARGKISQG
jgi:Aspartyl protease